MTAGRAPVRYPGGYVIHRRAGVCWITSEPDHTDHTDHTDHADIAWRAGEPLAAVVVMIARAVDLHGLDITADVAAVVRDALTAMASTRGGA